MVAVTSPPAQTRHEETGLSQLLGEIRACVVCAEELPLGPRPVLRAAATSRLLILSQAPGTRVHETGLSFNDRSGDRLREWLGIDRETFYDTARIAILPMGFCYPGVDARGGDLPPIPRCAPLWHPRLLNLLPAVELTLLVGSYAIFHYLPQAKGLSMTEVVRNWRQYLPQYLPMPHPSWRNTGWLRNNSWFETELVPELRQRLRSVLQDREST